MIPQEVQRILQRLEAAGYEAYVVGGCVRDMLMGTAPHDWDVTTSALPEEDHGAVRSFCHSHRPAARHRDRPQRRSGL